jgi:hypothetical protein
VPRTRRRGRRDPLAVASLVLAILWLLGLGSLAAIALGLTARRRATHTEGTTLALAGIALGVVGLAIAVVFFATEAAPGAV